MSKETKYRLLRDIACPMFIIPKGEVFAKTGSAINSKDGAYTYGGNGMYPLHPDNVENNPEWFEPIPSPLNREWWHKLGIKFDGPPTNTATNREVKEGDIKDNIIELLKEDLECVHMYLDDKLTPRKDSYGKDYSIVGRIKFLEKYCYSPWIIKSDGICPKTKKHCDDECCPVGASCNLSDGHEDELTSAVPPENREVKEERIVVKNLQYMGTDVKSGYWNYWMHLSTDNIPSDKYDAVKQAIESVLNSDSSVVEDKGFVWTDSLLHKWANYYFHEKGNDVWGKLLKDFKEMATTCASPEPIPEKKETVGYEILSFKEYYSGEPEKTTNYLYPVCDGKIGPFNNAMLVSDWLKTQPPIYRIHSVLRKEDGEIFTVGDKVQHHFSKREIVIGNFNIHTDYIYANSGGQIGEFLLRSIIKLEEPVEAEATTENHLKTIKILKMILSGKKIYVECFPTDEGAITFPNSNQAIKLIL